jgi:hypothetical protein
MLAYMVLVYFTDMGSFAGSFCMGSSAWPTSPRSTRHRRCYYVPTASDHVSDHCHIILCYLQFAAILVMLRPILILVDQSLCPSKSTYIPVYISQLLILFYSVYISQLLILFYSVS